MEEKYISKDIHFKLRTKTPINVMKNHFNNNYKEEIVLGPTRVFPGRLSV